MQRRPFKPFGNVSALTLGGGGLGQVWGDTTREEAVATARLALDSGITHFDMAPMYGKGEAERVIGEAFKGIDKSSLQFTTKYRLGNVPAEQIYDKLNASLTRSLATMNIERVDLFFCTRNSSKMVTSCLCTTRCATGLRPRGRCFKRLLFPPSSVCSRRARSAVGASHWASSRRLKP